MNYLVVSVKLSTVDINVTALVIKSKSALTVSVIKMITMMMSRDFCLQRSQESVAGVYLRQNRHPCKNQFHIYGV